MAKFHKKPKGVEAIQYLNGNSEEIFKFLDFKKQKMVENDGTIFMLSKGGVVGAKDGDWIVREDDGLFSVVPDKLFKETYEEIK